MNYKSIYDNIIAHAISNVIEGYGEIHHIIPKCMGGSDIPENLVKLSARQHYIAHILLTKIYPNNNKLTYAGNMMTNLTNSRGYESVKRSFSENHPNKNPEFRRYISELMTDRVVVASTCKKLSERDMYWCTGTPSGMSGKKHTTETKKLLSELGSGVNNHFFGKKHTEDALGKMRGSGQSKNWVITSPDGIVYVIKGGLKRFCVEHDLQPDVFKKKVGKGKIPKARNGCNQQRINSQGWEINEGK